LTDKAAEIRHEIGEKMAELEKIEIQLKTLPAKAYSTKYGSYMVSVSGRRYVVSAWLKKRPASKYPGLSAPQKPILDEFAKIEGAVGVNESKRLEWTPKTEVKNETKAS